jgi:hypothetical protein
MKKIRVLKASFTQYIHYYKNLKLGLQRACLFLRDIEPHLEKYSQKNVTGYRYYNPDTQKEYFFLEKDITLIRDIIFSFSLDYIVMKSELLKLEEHSDFERTIVEGLKWFNLLDFDKLDFLLSLKTKDESKKLDILARLFFRTVFYDTLSITYDDFLLAFGQKILYFCIKNVKKLDEIKLVLDRFDLKDFEQLKNNSKIIKQLAKPVLDFILSLNPEKFFLKGNSFSKNFLKSTYPDSSMLLDLPDVFSLDIKKSRYIDLEDFFFFLEDLDDYRIYIEAEKLNSKFLKVNYLNQFKQMCIRFRSPQALEKVKRYCCDFLKKTLLDIEDLKLNDRFSIYYWEVMCMIRDIHSARLNLHTELFNYYVMSCFSSFEFNNRFLFVTPNKYKFLKKTKVGGLVKK